MQLLSLRSTVLPAAALAALFGAAAAYGQDDSAVAIADDPRVERLADRQAAYAERFAECRCEGVLFERRGDADERSRSFLAGIDPSQGVFFEVGPWSDGQGDGLVVVWTPGLSFILTRPDGGDYSYTHWSQEGDKAWPMIRSTLRILLAVYSGGEGQVLNDRGLSTETLLDNTLWRNVVTLGDIRDLQTASDSEVRWSRDAKVLSPDSTPENEVVVPAVYERSLTQDDGGAVVRYASTLTSEGRQPSTKTFENDIAAGGEVRRVRETLRKNDAVVFERRLKLSDFAFSPPAPAVFTPEHYGLPPVGGVAGRAAGASWITWAAAGLVAAGIAAAVLLRRARA